MIRVYIGGLLLGIILAFVACSEEDYPIGASPAWNYIPDNISSLTPKEQEELRKRLTTANNDKSTNETDKDNKQDDESNKQKTPKPKSYNKTFAKLDLFYCYYRSAFPRWQYEKGICHNGKKWIISYFLRDCI